MLPPATINHSLVYLCKFHLLTLRESHPTTAPSVASAEMYAMGDAGITLQPILPLLSAAFQSSPIRAETT